MIIRLQKEVPEKDTILVTSSLEVSGRGKSIETVD